ncbi:unnamed protein product [Pleuronectes platessa]|uniref:Uncharacterized protein n=1 Tax=Pleuronectes platessa TaxID=8262 RepID=A0A9N7TTN5_PLEPL|nr:unnamed protein product [Pleuronectes platessa]
MEDDEEDGVDVYRPAVGCWLFPRLQTSSLTSREFPTDCRSLRDAGRQEQGVGQTLPACGSADTFSSKEESCGNNLQQREVSVKICPSEAAFRRDTELRTLSWNDLEELDEREHRTSESACSSHSPEDFSLGKTPVNVRIPHELMGVLFTM